MKTLNDILVSMDSLSMDDTESVDVDYSDDGAISYDEVLSKDIAKTILGNSYDPKCTYKLITQSNFTGLCKINPNWPEGKEPVYDCEGRIIDGPVVEYVLNEASKEDALSYASMMAAIDNTKQNPFTVETRDLGPTRKRTWPALVMAALITLIMSLWLVFMRVIEYCGGGF